MVPARTRSYRVHADVSRALAGANRAGITHDDYVKGVTDFIEQRDLRDVVLVGHSFGGSVVSRVSQEIPSRLKRLVFHTAFVVEDGASVNDNFPPEQTDMFLKAASESPDNTVECLWGVFRDFFVQDARPQDARSVWERLVPQPFQPWDVKLDLGEFYRAGLPKSYVAALTTEPASTRGGPGTRAVTVNERGFLPDLCGSKGHPLVSGAAGAVAHASISLANMAVKAIKRTWPAGR